MIKETKYVTYKHLKIGQRIEGWKEDNSFHLAWATVKAINSIYVTLMIFGKNEEKVTSETAMFEVKLTDKEICNKYRNDVKEIMESLKNRLEYDEIGYHEMWNSWVCYDPYEMAAYCRQEKFKIVGYHELEVPKRSWTGTWLDIGIVAEYENGERFWCHTSKEIFDYLTREKYFMEEGLR